MQPIHELIKRIQYDSNFGKGNFVIGFYDRLEERIIRMPLREIYFEPEGHFLFYFTDEEGIEHNVPFHRIKSVYKDDKLIWHRGH